MEEKIYANKYCSKIAEMAIVISKVRFLVTIFSEENFTRLHLR